MASDVTTVLCDVTVPSLLSHIHEFTVNCILGSHASSTMIRYDSHWKRFKLWCSSVNVSYLPAKPFHIAMYLSTVFHYACQNNLSFAPNKAASKAGLLLMPWQTFLTSQISQQ
jgi:hypothetical protein